ncbi:MAG TPA: murein biosynthesis integral membrane protein MurJ [Terriglobia bacterium]|nr:murein biosynthesis integral membrane protein MurJ [Terriglobia bacterium]
MAEIDTDVAPVGSSTGVSAVPVDGIAPSGINAGRLAGAAGIVTASVVLSRFLGFLREWTVAHQVGSNAATDAYYAAFTLPDFLNYLVAGASLSVIFIPVFTKYVAEGKEDEGWHVFSTVVTFMTILLIVAVGIGEIFAPQIINLTSPGFAAGEKARVVFLTRLMLPAQICFVLGSILQAVQYAKGQFLVPSLGVVVYNAFIVIGGWSLARYIGMAGFAVGVLVGAVLGNFLLQVYGSTRAQARFRPNLNLRHPGFKLFLKLAVPIMLALSLTFTDNWIIRWFGSYLQAASITWLQYAKILMQVPLTSLGQAVGVVSFPIMARLYSEGKLDELDRTLSAALKGLLALMVPVSALLIAQSEPVVYLVFSHTRLRGPDFHATGAALGLFALGMFAWAGQYLLSRGFFAIHNSWTPALVGTGVTLASLPMYSYLVHHYGYLGLALSSSLGIAAFMLVLFVLLNWKLKSHTVRGNIVFFLKISAASAVSGGATWMLDRVLRAHIPWHSMLGAFVLLAIGSSAGLAVTMLLAKILRIREFTAQLDKALNMVRRRLGRGRRPAAVQA